MQEENGPTVYSIGLLGEERQRRARRALETISERTGGIAFFPRTLDEVDSISSAVARDIRNQYTIAYAPLNQALDGSYRTIRLTVTGPDHYTVRTRPGYRAVTDTRESAGRSGRR